MSTGTPIAGDIVVDPGIEFKTIKADTLFAYGYLRKEGPNLYVETIAIHAEIARRIAKPKNARQEHLSVTAVHA